jgi:uncharacterized protein
MLKILARASLVLLFLAPALAAAQATGRDAALIDAAEAGGLLRVKQLLAAGASVKARDARGRTALMAATYGNRVETARVLIAAGSDVNQADREGVTPLAHAKKQGYDGMVRILEGAGAR